MSPPTRKAAIAATLVAGAAGHGIMTIPVARPDTSDPRGTKFTPFSDARNLANRGCGEADKGGLNTVQQPIQVYQRGAAIQVQWEHTIPHPADNRDTGVRIALHYGPGDSFECNVSTSTAPRAAPHFGIPARLGGLRGGHGACLGTVHACGVARCARVRDCRSLRCHR